MRQAVELSPKNPEYLMRLGLVLTMQERPKVAAIFFERALKLDPDNLTLRRHLAGSQWQGGRLDASKENLEVILKANPRDSEALLMLGMVLMDAGRFPAAHAMAQRATEAMPSSDQAYAVKGMAEMRMQRYTEAAKSYKQAVELNPKAPDVNLGLAMSLWAAGNITESFAIFEQGLKRFPEDAFHCLEYGRLLLKSAKPDDSAAETRAIGLLQNALTLNRSLPEAHYWLGDLALRRGNPEKALEHLEQAVKLDPGSSKIHFALSRTHRRLGRMARAGQKLSQRHSSSATAADGDRPRAGSWKAKWAQDVRLPLILRTLCRLRLRAFDEFFDALGIAFGMAVAGHRVAAAGGFDENIGPDHARFDMNGGHLADGDRHFILTEPGSLAACDRFVADFDRGRE
jgi:tetratricopeptide (TPR) repeat protein